VFALVVWSFDVPKITSSHNWDGKSESEIGLFSIELGTKFVLYEAGA
jgi:hypothetical protein